MQFFYHFEPTFCLINHGLVFVESVTMDYLIYAKHMGLILHNCNFKTCSCRKIMIKVVFKVCCNHFLSMFLCSFDIITLRQQKMNNTTFELFDQEKNILEVARVCYFALSNNSNMVSNVK